VLTTERAAMPLRQGRHSRCGAVYAPARRHARRLGCNVLRYGILQEACGAARGLGWVREGVASR
jgi:hypothetical protein